VRIRRFLGPKWVFGHLVVIAAAVTMVQLGFWQLHVSESKHFDIKNFGYALQWWAFTTFGLAMWVKVMVDADRQARGVGSSGSDPGRPAVSDADDAVAGAAGTAVAYRRYSMPQSSVTPVVAVDSEHAAYNAYLAELADRGER
jgi:hypothetical protein